MASDMARTPEQEYEKALNTLENAVESGDVTEDDAEAIRQLCRAFDPEDARESLPSGDDLYGKGRGPKGKGKHKEYRTLSAWCERLTALAQGIDLTDDGDVTGHIEGLDLTAENTTPEDVNRFTTKLKKADNGPGTSHIRNIEYAAGKFYRFHDVGIDPDAIVVHEYDTNNGRNGWDERDLLDADERAALRTVADHPRDRVILNLLLYCGMRNTALRTLRLRDINLDNHEWYFNTTADGLKNIDRPTEPRPLFQAERAVREWLDQHPNPQPDHYLITAKRSASKKDPTRPITRETIRYTMQTLKKRTADRDDVATVEKPCHPHMMRHNFVSNKRKHPDVTDADIKFWIGHAPKSDVMQTTYSHLSSDDHNTVGHDAFGVSDAEGDDDTPEPWDETCIQCNRVIHPSAEECDMCGAESPELPFDIDGPKPPAEAAAIDYLLADAGEQGMTAEQVANHLVNVIYTSAAQQDGIDLGDLKPGNKPDLFD